MTRASELDVKLNRDIFTRRLIRELVGVLQERIGIDEASGYISLVGMEMGKEIESFYKDAWGVETLNAEQVAEVLIDLKKRISGDFHILEQSPEKIVMGNRQCPFERDVNERPSLCMMTSTVFGGIAARNMGYAKVCLDRTIARGDPQCNVVVYLQDTTEARTTKGIEYYPQETVEL